MSFSELRQILEASDVALSQEDRNKLLVALSDFESLAENAREAAENIEIALRILAVANRGKDCELLARANFVVALLLRTLGRWNDSEIYAEIALNRFRQLDEMGSYGRAQLLLGALASDRGDNLTALQYYKAARDSLIVAEDPSRIAASYYNESLILLQTGFPQEALVALQRAQTAYREQNDVRSDAICTIWYGSIFRQFGKLSEAIAAYQTAYETLNKLGMQRRAAACLLNAGNIQLDAGRFREATAMFRRAKAIYEAIGDTNRSAGCELNLGFVQFAQLDYEGAKSKFQDALTCFVEQNDLRHECEAQLWSAECSLRLQELDHADKKIARASDLAKQLGEQVSLARACALKGRLLSIDENQIDAIDAFEASLSLLESLHVSVFDPEAAAKLHRWTTPATSWATQAALRNSDFAKAISLLRRFKRLSFRAPGNKRFPMSDEIIQLRRQTSEAQIAVEQSCGIEERRARIAERDRLLLELSQLESRLSSSAESSPTEIRNLAGSSCPMLPYIEYAVDESGISLLWQSFDSPPCGSFIPIPIAELEGMIGELTSLIASAHSSTEMIAHMMATMRNLLIPQQLRTIFANPHIIICPHDVLHSVPFELLLEQESCSISLMPTSAIDSTYQQVFEPNVPAFFFAKSYQEDSDPGLLPLPCALEEIAVAQEYVNRESLTATESAATPHAVLHAMPNAYLIHLAMHAIANTTIPSLSHLVMSGDDAVSRRLYAREILERSTNARLIVLSACSSASGELTGTAGPLSIAWSFLVAGARSVIASRYPVHDRAALLWMSNFYSKLTDDSSIADAAKFASHQLRNEPEFSHPHFRACWVLFGMGQ